ncbi:MAG: hypothetical protein DME33_06170 [Verrucomicrobia bacterium]|nr:MAG: hypothetical protein DME33_06170 [Verrucomicrobiota bacterium]
MRSFQQRLSDFNARGIRVMGISVDPPEINRRQSQKLGYAFPLLSDRKAEVIRRYDVLHPGAGPKGADIARPAEFLIDSSGVNRACRAMIDGAPPNQYVERACIRNWNNCSFSKIGNKRSNRFRPRSKRCRCNATTSNRSWPEA